MGMMSGWVQVKQGSDQSAEKHNLPNGTEESSARLISSGVVALLPVQYSNVHGMRKVR